MGKMLPMRRKLGKPDFERMNLPEDFWTAKVQGVAEKVRPRVIRYLKQVDTLIPKGVGLFLHGAPGVGKTGVAALVCKEARSAGFTVYFTSIWEMRELIKHRVAFDDETSLTKRCQDVDVLVLDGLQQDDANDKFFGAREIEEIIASRARARRATFVTTRLTPQALASAFPSITEVARGCMVHLSIEGPNLRAKTQDELKLTVFGD